MPFLDYFCELEDPRLDINKKHNLLDILFLTATAILSGAEGWKDIKAFGDAKLVWLRQYRQFSAGIPVDDTIARVISSICPEQLTKCFVGWVNELRNKEGREQIAIDGKTLRRSFTEERATALHSITAWSKSNGLVLAQLKSKGKKNENESVLEMLDLLELKNSIITMDAMNTQKKIVEKINHKGGDYILSLKGNHKNLRDEIKTYFEKMKQNNFSENNKNYYEEIDAGHGRIETRRYRQLMVSEWITEANQWSNLRSLIEVKRERQIKDKIENETQYYISSLPIDAKVIADAIRGHWEVENKAHWVLDVTFKEDDCRIRRNNSAENMATLRRFALNLARLHPHKNSMRGKLKQAMWSDDFRSELLLGQKVSKV